jgi:hypothetical protein
MYFWKTAQLADNIKNNRVSEKSKMLTVEDQKAYLSFRVLININRLHDY